ncbi:MAG: YchJ family metal-binding protein [Mycobacterium sp.]
MRPDNPCPCGTGNPYGRCCLPSHHGEREARSAEQLMRARYSAYAVGDCDYLWRTWHPRTRPNNVADAGLVWTRLEIIDSVAGGPGDDSGEVEFRAHYRDGVLHERSRFSSRAGRWFYLDGDRVD